MKTAADVLAALRERFPAQAWALLTDVANGTGRSANRFADAIAMSLWPSRGLEILGIEVKVSRTDWVRELNNPAKADPLAAYCDSWYLAVNDAAIVATGELPKSWGLLAPGKDGKLSCKKEAERNPSPKFDRSFLASVLRRVCKQLTSDARIEVARAEGRALGREAAAANAQCEIQEVKSRLEGLHMKLSDFETKSGISIENGWNLGLVGEIVRTIQNGSYLREKRNLVNLLDTSRRITSSLEVEVLKLK